MNICVYFRFLYIFFKNGTHLHCTGKSDHTFRKSTGPSLSNLQQMRRAEDRSDMQLGGSWFQPSPSESPSVPQSMKY